MVKLLNTVFMTLLAAVFVVGGMHGLYLNSTWADVIGAARAVELSANKPSPGLLRLVDKMTAEQTQSSKSPACIDEVSRSWMTLWLFNWERSRSEGGAALTNSSLEAIRDHLLCFPTDGNAWMWRGKILARKDGPSAESASAFEVSYWTAPSERWIMLPRFVSVVPLLEAQEFRRLKPTFEADLERLVAGLSAHEVAEVYVGSSAPIRTVLLDFIAASPMKVQTGIINEIDRLGLTVRLPPPRRSP